MADSDAVPLPPQTPQSTPRPPDDGLTFRIPRVQEWTLGAVIVAAVSFRIWMGTLNEKLGHIEKFVDAASDLSAGIFVRLATIQKSLDILDKNRPAASDSAANNSRMPVIVVRSTPENQGHDLIASKLIDYKLAEMLLKPAKEASSMEPSKTSAEIDGVSHSESSQQQSLSWEHLRTIALQQLEQLEQDVKQNPKITEPTRTDLLNLIAEQHQRVFSRHP
jgi:hypothetical protein